MLFRLLSVSLILTLIRLIALYSTYVDDKEFHSRNAGVIGTPLVARLTHECCHKGQSSRHCGICPLAVNKTKKENQMENAEKVKLDEFK